MTTSSERPALSARTVRSTDSPRDPGSPTDRGPTISRRTLAAGAAWSAPVIALSAPAYAAAVSPPYCAGSTPVPLKLSFGPVEQDVPVYQNAYSSGDNAVRGFRNPDYTRSAFPTTVSVCNASNQGGSRGCTIKAGADLAYLNIRITDPFTLGNRTKVSIVNPDGSRSAADGGEMADSGISGFRRRILAPRDLLPGQCLHLPVRYYALTWNGTGDLGGDIDMELTLAAHGSFTGNTAEALAARSSYYGSL